MGDRTGIEWTDATWNPIRGCSRVSEGCRHCYAETVAARFSGAGQPYEGLARRTSSGEARWTGEVRFIPEHLADPLRWQRPRRVFVNSMSDLFHDGVTDEQLAAIFAVMALAERHVFQVLTKRPARMQTWCATLRERYGSQLGAAELLTGTFLGQAFSLAQVNAVAERFARGALPNVWLGVSVEDQAAADARIHLLLDTPAAVRFLSMEPLLGPVDLGAVRKYVADQSFITFDARDRHGLHQWTDAGVDWVIVGGESGPRARPMHPAWARALRDQCACAGVPFFFKQWGEWIADDADPRVLEAAIAHNAAHQYVTDPTCGHARMMFRLGKVRAGRELDGRTWDEMPASPVAVGV
ncbi:Gp37Gp68 family protein (plasmid) [Gemmatirosa kalamazoonensis]|uniref:Gp37Gp68 family protein n=1 Tax=Gemmatirosa kalamazoonensis TaxID=861299 RepID=W0RNL9_9BACT|nr:phage Gp37/Gp68 family protein [Gemmatirosa kalamazoonensis]AHG92092.1 Gp37Gp68 family protein [Gemmatirosa kalamazoonensis]AHG92160.1 Gp37Gp68 family protein [Gemmatirosa kalamazoonensis]